MSYATLEQLIERYGESMLVGLTDRGEIATGAIDNDVVARALADTDAVIDARLAARYDLASIAASVPAILIDIALSIAIWKLHRHEPNQKIKDDYADAMKQLSALSDGSARLPLAGGGEPQSTGTTGARVTDRARPLTEESMTGYI